MTLTVKVVRDDDVESPREWDNWGVMATWHRNYNLGDVQPRQSPSEWLADTANVPRGSVVLPLYLYDHSGITMSTSAFSCRWDSGQVGYIVATPERMRKMGGWKLITAKRRALVESYLRQEVETYDDYLTGNAWGFVIERDGVHVDSCWGFIGSDPSTLPAMQEHTSDPEIIAAMALAWESRS